MCRHAMHTGPQFLGLLLGVIGGLAATTPTDAQPPTFLSCPGSAIQDQTAPFVQHAVVRRFLDPRSSLQGTAQGSVIIPVNFEIAIEAITGHRAIEYLKAKREKHPARFRRQGRELRHVGATPTDNVLVLRTLALADVGKDELESSSVAPASTTVANGQGEVIFWSWTDGDNATWEGTTYFERYSDGAWRNFDGQVNIATEDYYAQWGTETSRGGPDIQTSLDKWTTEDYYTILATESGGRSSSDKWHMGWFHGFYGNPEYRDWIGCVAGITGGCTTTCIVMGAAWPDCMGACAAGALVNCALQWIF
jgi:hypothetical protein